MTCVICGRETHMGEAYALPRLVRVGIGIANLYACSCVCRDQWNAAQIAPPEPRQESGTPNGPDADPIEPPPPDGEVGHNSNDTPPDAAEMKMRAELLREMGAKKNGITLILLNLPTWA